MDQYNNAADSSGSPPAIPERELLEWLASISPRHEAELRRLRRAEAEAEAKKRHERELLEWLASISDKHERELHALLQQEAEERQSQERSRRLVEDPTTGPEWVEADHPRRPKGTPDGGEWVKKGDAGGSSAAGGEEDRPGSDDGATGHHPKKTATPEMLDLAHAWWQTHRLLQRARRDIDSLPKQIAHERSQFGSGGRYASLHPQHVAELQRDLEAAKNAAPELEKQLHELEQQYHDSGYDEVEYNTWTRDETQVGGHGIADVGRAVGLSAEPDSLERTGDETDLFNLATGVFQLGKVAIKTALGRAAARLQSQVDAFVAKLPRKITPTRTAANRYEIKHTGPYNYTVSGGGAKFDIDGYRGSKILEAKYAGNPKSSPYVPGSSCPDKLRAEILDGVREELRKAHTIIRSGETPFKSVEIITNSPESKKLFEKMLKESGVRGTVRLEQ
jgi:hypothetical protein